MKYIVSRDLKSGLYYAHAEGYAYVPVMGSISERKSDAAEYAKMYNNLPNRVEQIEKKRRETWQQENG